MTRERMVPTAASLLLAGGLMCATPVVAQDYQALVDAAHVRFKDDQSGANADYIPILTEVPSELFGVASALRMFPSLSSVA